MLNITVAYVIFTFMSLQISFLIGARSISFLIGLRSKFSLSQKLLASRTLLLFLCASHLSPPPLFDCCKICSNNTQFIGYLQECKKAAEATRKSEPYDEESREMDLSPLMLEPYFVYERYPFFLFYLNHKLAILEEEKREPSY
jgi:hypothetical protein